MFCKGKENLDSEVVFVREFRTAGGFVTELPGGSVLDDTHRDPIDVALEEASEEVGFSPNREFVISLGSRACAPTLASHPNHAFAVEVTAQQMQKFKEQHQNKVFFGKSEDTERTYVVVKTIRECFADTECCWTTLGILGSLMQKLK